MSPTGRGASGRGSPVNRVGSDTDARTPTPPVAPTGPPATWPRWLSSSGEKSVNRSRRRRNATQQRSWPSVHCAFVAPATQQQSAAQFVFGLSRPDTRRKLEVGQASLWTRVQRWDICSRRPRLLLDNEHGDATWRQANPSTQDEAKCLGCHFPPHSSSRCSWHPARGRPPSPTTC